MDERRDPYEILGVSRTASSDEVRKAYRQAALKHHPDRNAGDGDAAARFKEATEAFQILSNDERRAVYDQYGFAGLDGGGGMPGVDLGDMFGNFQDLFSEFFGGGSSRGRSRGPQRGPDLRVGARLSLRDAAFGCKREISFRYPGPCDGCKGSGAAAGTSPVTCASCRGTGQVSSARGFVMFTGPCAACRGEGKTIQSPCAECRGSGQRERTKKVVVSFPAGIDEGQVLRIAGQGVAGPSGGPPGDVLVQVDLEPDPRFERHGVDLATQVQVSVFEAMRGASVDVPTIDDAPLSIDIPAGTQHGHVVVVRGRGIPRLEGKGRNRGALHVVVGVNIPKLEDFSPKAKSLFEALQVELKERDETR